MARAKRTDRAEARRKYRAYLLGQEEAASEADNSGSTANVAGSKPALNRGQRPQAVVQPGARMGIFAAAKAAYRTPHYIDDIRNIRSLVFHSKAVWPVLLVCVAAGAFIVLRFASGADATDPAVRAVLEFTFFPIPLLPPMIAGFLAPRSSWLAGLIAAFIATMTIVWVVAMTALTMPGYGGTLSATNLISTAVNLLQSSLAVGVIVAAGTAWYKRFLTLSAGSRKRPPAKSGSQRPAQRRRPATRG